MAGESTVTSLTGLYKIVYGKLFPAVNGSTKFLRDIPFAGGKEGAQYQNAIVTQDSQGFTMLGSKYASAATLTTPTPATVEKQIFNGAEMFYDNAIIINSISYAQGNAAAFAKATRPVFESDKRSIDNRTEFQTVYGQSGILDLGTQSGKTGSAGAITLDIPDAQYFAGLKRSKGHWVVARETADGTAEVGGSSVVYRISAIGGTLGSYTITLQEVNVTTTADVTTETNADALGTAIASTATTLWFYNPSAIGDPVSYEPLGIRKILNTTTGNLFNIAVSNPNYGPNPYTLTGAPSSSHFEDLCQEVVDKGLDDVTLNIYVSPVRWSLLMKNDLEANKTYNDSANKSNVTLGTGEYMGRSQEGVRYKVISSHFVKNGDIFALPQGAWKRHGAHDWKQVVNDMGSMFVWLGNNSFKYAFNTIQAPFTEQPNHSVYGYGATLS